MLFFIHQITNNPLATTEEESDMKKVLAFSLALLSVIALSTAPSKTAMAAMMEKDISADRALQIALNKAGYIESEVGYSHVEDDTEDGVRVYEVKLVVGHVEYTYEIDMTTGKILDSEVDL